MGSPTEEACREKDEGPRHEVTLRPFLLARTEVSQRAWQALAERAGVPPQPSSFRHLGELAPVETVSWSQARSWCEAAGLRLPTEAEWEYACRGGTTTPFAFGEEVTTEQVNFSGLYPYRGGPAQEYRQQPVPVGSLAPSSFGLYEVHGNLREWCEDSYIEGHEGAPTDGSSRVDPGSLYRVIRGGSWSTDARFCRSADRFWCNPEQGFDFLGLRPASALTR